MVVSETARDVLLQCHDALFITTPGTLQVVMSAQKHAHLISYLFFICTPDNLAGVHVSEKHADQLFVFYLHT